MSATLQITAITNAATPFIIQWADENDNPIDLSAYTFRAGFKRSDGSGGVAFVISTANGFIVDAGLSDGFVKITIPKAVAPAGSYNFDLLMTNSGQDFLMADGTLTINQGITE